MAYPTLAGSTLIGTGYGTGPWSVTDIETGFSRSNGDLLLFVVRGGSNIDPTASPGTGWTKLSSQTDLNSWVFVAWGKICNGSDNFSLDRTGEGQEYGGMALHITGWYGTLDTDSILIAKTADFSGNWNCPASGTTSWASAENLFIAWGGKASDSNYPTGAPTNYGGLDAGGNGSYGSSAIATRNYTSTSDDPGDFSGCTQTALVATIAVRPAAASGSKVPIFMSHYAQQGIS